MSVTVDSSSRRRAIAAGTIGNILEYYDFAIYASLTPIIAPLFFPTQDPALAFLAAFGAYAVGFLARPLGGFVFGHFGDKVGRRTTLAAAVIMMAVSTLLIGILPTYATIGLLAPILLVVARLVQGFSAAGEWGGSAVFMVEYAPENRRGLFGSMQQFGVAAGFLAGLLVAALLTNVVPEEVVSGWAWRIPFIAGLLIGIVGLYLRLRLEDTPNFQALEETNEVERAPLLTMVRTNYKELLIIMGFTALWGSAYHLFTAYMPTYISENIGFSLSSSLAFNAVGLASFVLLIPPMGWLSDKVGRKPMLVGAALGFVVLTYPIFLLLSQATVISVVLALLAIALLLAVFSGPGPAALVELFPTKIRYSALGVGYNLSVTIFGGTAPFIATLLTSRTDSALSPSFYAIFTALITLVAVVSMRETYKAPLK